MKKCPIFITSADSYADLWPIYFDLFAQYWPEYDGVIYLNTETKEYSHAGLNIICTKVGKKDSFGKTFLAGLDLINSEDVLLAMIDFFIMGTVNNSAMKEYYDFFKDNKLDSLCLMEGDYPTTAKLDHPVIRRIIPPSKDMFSFQAAFWKKAMLREMILPHESPWLSEWYGTKRANIMNLNLACVTGKQVMPYLATGALNKGKWVEEITIFLNQNDKIPPIDYTKRGLHAESVNTLKLRIKARLNTFYPRILSNIDLWKRRLG